jgi:hypothetical protein
MKLCRARHLNISLKNPKSRPIGINSCKSLKRKENNERNMLKRNKLMLMKVF